MSNKFADYKDAFTGKRAWIIGSGPSLDIEPLINIPDDDIIMCINITANNVKRCDFVFAHDQITIPLIDKDTTYVIDYSLKNYLNTKQRENAILYNKYQFGINGDFEWITSFTKEQMCSKEMLLGMWGTIHSMIHFCWFSGISHIMLIGIDPEQHGVYHQSQDVFGIINNKCTHLLIHYGTLALLKHFNISMNRIIIKNEL